MSKLNMSDTTASIWTRRLWKGFVYSFLFTVLFLASIKFGLWGKLPDTMELENPKTKLASEVYSSDSKVLGKMFYQEDRTNSAYADIPQHLKDALIPAQRNRC